MKKLILIGYLFCVGCSSNEVHKTNYVLKEDNFIAYSGLIAPKASDYLKMETSKMIRSFAGAGGDTFSHLPPEVDLASGLPEAGNQGNQNSCTGFALAFAVKSFQENRELGWGLADHLFSPAFLYNSLNGGKDEGVDLADVLEFISNHGTVPLSVMPYNEADFRTQPTEVAKEIALNFRGLGYRRLDEKNVHYLKASLAAGEPVLLVIEMYENFLKRGMQQSAAVYSKKGGKSLGYHALVAVGYDAKGIKILNSWGKTWGENGFGWIDTDFAPKVIKQAFIVYDTPTPPATVALFNSRKMPEQSLAHQETVSKPVAQKSSGGIKSGAAELSDRLLILPEEAGITINGEWLRLAQELKVSDKFFTVKTSDLFNNIDLKNGSLRVQDDGLQSGNVNKILFYPNSEIPIYTNEGVTFGSKREDVHRIYGAPDFVDQTGLETYFFHAITENWGGIKITKHASLNFQFNDDGTVSFMSLENVFKDVLMGKGMQKVEGAVEGAVEGITSDDKLLRFTPPAGFTDVNKSVWPGTGYGYFIKNPENNSEYIAVKSFQTTEAVSDSLIQTRMEANAKIYQMTGNVLPRSFAGLDWKCQDGGTAYFCYGGRGTTLYQIQIASGKLIAHLPWPEAFLQSITIK